MSILLWKHFPGVKDTMVHKDYRVEHTKTRAHETQRGDVSPSN